MAIDARVDVERVLLAIAARLLACNPFDVTSTDDASNDAYSNAELATQAEAAARQYRRDWQGAIEHGHRAQQLSPEEMVRTARAYALVPPNGAVSVEPAFLAELARLAAAGLKNPTDTYGVPS